MWNRQYKMMILMQLKPQQNYIFISKHFEKLNIYQNIAWSWPEKIQTSKTQWLIFHLIHYPIKPAVHVSDPWSWRSYRLHLHLPLQANRQLTVAEVADWPWLPPYKAETSELKSIVSLWMQLVCHPVPGLSVTIVYVLHLLQSHNYPEETVQNKGLENAKRIILFD